MVFTSEIIIKLELECLKIVISFAKISFFQWNSCNFIQKFIFATKKRQFHWKFSVSPKVFWELGSQDPPLFPPMELGSVKSFEIKKCIKDLSTISTISGSRNLTISSISGSRNLLVHFCKFWIQKRQYFRGFWIQKSHHFYNIWIQKYFGPFSWFLDPEIAVFLKFLDPETAPFLQFLDCHSITRNWVIIWIRECSSITSARFPRFWTPP